MSEDGLYPVKLTVTKEGLVGAPTLTLNLLVNAPDGTVTGEAVITQAVTPTEAQVTVPSVKGNIHHTGLGADQMLVSLSGDFIQSVPPPAIGSYLAHFSAALAVDKGWNGRGTYTYATHTITDATVTAG